MTGDRIDISIGGSVSGQVVAGHGNVTHVGVPVPVPGAERPDLRGAARIIVVGDVQDSGSRDNREQLTLRAGLEAAFRAGTSALGQSWEDVERLDLGDGLRLVMSPDATALPAVLDAFVTHFADRLDADLRMRLCVHFGFLDRTAGAWSGSPLVHAARLVDAAEAKQRLRDAEHARLAVIVSEYVHAQIVRQRYPGVGPEAYRRITVIEKETMASAWLRVI